MSRVVAPSLAVVLLALAGCPKEAPPVPPPPTPPAAIQSDTQARASTGKRQIALFVPHEDLFWADFKAFMEAATDAFGIELLYFVADNSRELMKQQLREVTSGPDRVDAVVFQSFKKNGGDLLTIANQARVPAFLVNAGVDPKTWGRPREHMPMWLGTMTSDGVAAGYRLGTLLADEARRMGLADADGKIHAIAIGGIVSDAGSKDRLKGLEKAVAERKALILHQAVPTDWTREDGALKAASLLKRFPMTTVVWAASDPLALGAVESLKAAGREPGVDCLVGGFDWTAEALEAIRDGELHASLGGEFMAGGWVAVLLNDYLDGHDFATKRLEFQTRMEPITKTNVGRFLPAISGAEWGRVQFRELSAPGGRYSFDAVETLRALSDE